MSWSRQNLSDRHPIPVSMLVSQYERITSHLCVSVQIGRVSPSTPVGCGYRVCADGDRSGHASGVLCVFECAACMQTRLYMQQYT